MQTRFALKCLHMANTYTQIYIQIVFAVKRRENLIQPEHREELHKYMIGICKNHDQKMLAVFAMPDHVHLFAGFRPVISISDLVKHIKAGSSKFINEQDWMRQHFNWQDGFGAFSYSHSQIDTVVKYVLNQEAHHKRQTFRQEYIQLLEEFGIKYDERYLFDDVLGV
jgi:putative transposase